MINRKNTRKIKVGNLLIGGGNPIAVQSMTNTDTRDVPATVNQIKKLQDAGCEIIRVSIPDIESARNISKIKSKIKIPLVADIHFDWRLAVEAIEQGADKLRINPGNIGSKENVERVVIKAKKYNVPIRIGVNAGSLKTFHKDSNISHSKKAKLLVDSAFEHIKILESLKYFNTIVSLKASDVPTTIEACRLFASKSNYPLHLGITEAGSIFRGTVKSSVGLGILLNMGVGDTLRVSLTADPVEEVKAAYQILQSLELRSTGIEIVSCPTCSRCQVDMIGIVDKLEKKLSKINFATMKLSKNPVKIAVMGCIVNGPGEAKEADFGIAGGKNSGILFNKGKIIGKISSNKWVETLVSLVKKTIRYN